MGFDVNQTVVVLDFSGTRFDGFEVRVRPDALSVSGWFEFWDASKKAESVAEELGWLIEHGVIEGWNAERDGAPVPLSTEGARQLPVALAKKITSLWVGLVGSPDIPLAQPSPAGGS